MSLDLKRPGEKKLSLAVAWSILSMMGNQGLLSLFTLVIAAIINPAAFGVLAMAMVYIAFAEMVLGLGFNAAVIQKKNLRDEHLDSVFWVVLLGSVLLCAGTFALADTFAVLNKTPELEAVIKALSFMIPLRAMIIMQQAVLQRFMAFKELALRDVVAAMMGGGVGLVMAISGFGVWALVAQQLTMNAVSLALLLFFSKWVPLLRFDLKAFNELLGVSSKVFLGQVGTYLQSNMDAFLIGVFFGPVALGLYRLSMRLVNTVLSITSRAVQNVSLPYFSNMKNDSGNLVEGYFKCIRFSSITTIPATCLLAASSEMVVGLLGEEWLIAGKLVKILCLVGIVKSLTLFTSPLLIASGKSGTQSMLIWFLTIVDTVGLITVGWLYIDYDLQTQIVAIALTKACVLTLFYLPLNIVYARNLLGFTMKNFMYVVWPSFLTSVCIIAAVEAAKVLCRQIDMGNMWTLGIIVCAAGLTYLLCLMYFEKEMIEKLKRVVRDREYI